MSRPTDVQPTGSVLRFDCRTCGRRAALPRPPTWATDTAWVDCVGWLAGPDDDALRPAMPTTGEAVSLRVRHPFQVAAGAPFSALFQPPRAALDGWIDDPPGLLRSAWVTLRADRWGGGEVHARVEATVLAVQPFDALPTAVADAPLVDDDLVVPCWPAGSASRVVVDGLELIDGNAQGDVGGWVVLRGDIVWVHGRWGFHEDAAFFGPARLTPTARARLDAAWGARGH